MKPVSVMLVALALLGATSASARPGERFDESVRRLSYETRELDRQVQMSALYYEAKNAVSRFRYDVEQLDRCASYSGGPCRYELQRTRDSFSVAERYLYNTNYNFPYVYNQYLRTRDALRWVGGGGGGGGGGYLHVNGAINGWQFNYAGRDQREIFDQCMRDGRYHGIYYISTLFIEGRQYSEYQMILDRACDLVARYSHP